MVDISEQSIYVEIHYILFWFFSRTVQHSWIKIKKNVNKIIHILVEGLYQVIWFVKAHIQ